MKNEDQAATTRAQLSRELADLQQRIATLEVLEANHKRTEAALRKANRAYKMLSDCNQALVRATEETALLTQVCQIIVEVGGYRLVWVGLAEQDEAKTVRPVAQAGYEAGGLDRLNITWADTERGRGPTGSAIRTGKPSVSKNMLHNRDYAPWRAEATRHGCVSSIYVR